MVTSCLLARCRAAFSTYTGMHAHCRGSCASCPTWHAELQCNNAGQECRSLVRLGFLLCSAPLSDSQTHLSKSPPQGVTSVNYLSSQAKTSQESSWMGLPSFDDHQGRKPIMTHQAGGIPCQHPPRAWHRCCIPCGTWHTCRPQSLPGSCSSASRQIAACGGLHARHRPG